jgi:hypothetical protein
VRVRGTGAGFGSFGGDGVCFAAENGEFVFRLSVDGRRAEYIVWVAGCDAVIGFEIYLLSFHLQTLDDGLNKRV